MKTIEDMPQAAEGQVTVTVAVRTIAALSQLDPTERDDALNAIQALRSYGLHKGPDLDVERLSEPVGTYAVRVPTPSDLRLIVREGEGGSLVVLSLFRAETLRGLFHAS